MKDLSGIFCSGALRAPNCCRSAVIDRRYNKFKRLLAAARYRPRLQNNPKCAQIFARLVEAAAAERSDKFPPVLQSFDDRFSIRATRKIRQ